MKKTIYLSIISILACINVNAQSMATGVIKIFRYDSFYFYKVAEYTTDQVDKVVYGQVAEYVDLGLPSGTLWATCNVGASQPEEYGLYFAWGETVGYTGDTSDGRSFNWANYKWCNGSSKSLTKYCTLSSMGTVDNKAELESTDDAASVNLASASLQIPTLDQIEELYNSNYTTIKKTTENGVYGCKITSNTNNNSIFIPAGGFRQGASLIDAGSSGQFWSRTLDSDCPWVAYNGDMSRGKARFDRYFGLNVRPVLVKK